jgi:endonuclease/exonuclease/phosphatase family metal-dependent hydrolase
MRPNLTQILRVFLFIISLSLPATANAQSGVHVDRNGSADPDSTAAKPFHVVRAGVCRAETNGKVVLHPGDYNEAITITHPMSLTSTGKATIGRLAGKAHTTLKVLTYNTHLFGNEGAGLFPQFADRTRAAYIAEWIRLENADVVGLEEVWDKELADAIVDRVTAVYPHHYYNNARDEDDDVLGSGLMLLSKHPIINPSLKFYRDEVSISDCVFSDPLCPVKNPTEPWKCCIPYLDGFSSKGFVQATIIKDGFQLGVFITHTQAEHHKEGMNARRKQLEQIGSQIQLYRTYNPAAEVIMMGDINIIGRSEDYYNSLLFQTKLFDIYPNLVPCPDISLDQATCDYNRNDLARHFDNTAFDCDNKRLDYVLYSHGKAFDVLPAKLEVRRYLHPTSDEGKMMNDLSDHYGVAAEFSLWRNN